MLECQIEIRVVWGDCDPAQIVYNPHFFDWMERGLSTLFETAGLGFADLIARQPDLRGTPLVRSHAEFHAPARIGDLIELSSKISRWGRSSFDIDHEFRLGDTVLVTASQTRVWSGVDADGNMRGLPVPPEVRTALEEDRLVRYRIAPEEAAPEA